MTRRTQHKVLVVFVNVKQFNELEFVELINIYHNEFPDYSEKFIIVQLGVLKGK